MVFGQELSTSRHEGRSTGLGKGSLAQDAPKSSMKDMLRQQQASIVNLQQTHLPVGYSMVFIV
jgi:hypothetical protein